MALLGGAVLSCAPKQADPMEQALAEKILQAVGEEGKG